MKNGEYELIIAPVEYPGKLYRDKYAYEHHIVYWQHTGYILQKGEEIHHKNRNKRWNVFSNLEIRTKAKHAQYHGLLKGKTMVDLICPVCGSSFTREKRQTHLIKKSNTTTLCSRSCAGIWSHMV